MSAFFTIHGIEIEVGSPSASALDEITRDFAFFTAPGAVADEHLRVECRLETPAYDALPDLRASFLTPRNVCYRDDNRMLIDYFGRGLAVWDRASDRCVLTSADAGLLHQMTYLFILSTVGQRLDALGLHRVHALGVSHQGRGVLLMLPSGGGKSTLALGLRNESDFRLLSDETPLIDKDGRVLPFPQRIGVRVGEAGGVDPKFLHTVSRIEFDSKTLIDIDHFAGRIGSPAPVEMLLIGERHSGATSEIVPTSRPDAVRELIKNMVVGIGVYQGLEFLLERGWSDAFKQTGVGLSRLARALTLAGRARAFRFRMGRDRDKNFRTFVDFMRSP